MFKKLDNYKYCKKMKKLRTQLEHAQRGGSMDLVKEIESKINKFCQYQEYKIKFENEEV